MEEYAYILDIPPQSHGRRENICYAVGDRDFKLFELVYKAGVVLQFEDRVYIGKEAEQRTAIDHVKRRIGYDELSSTAQSELEYAVRLAVKADEELPGLGKKSMMAIIEERRKEEFKDLADIAARVPSVKNPEKLIVARIMLEIMDADRKRYLFVER